MSWVSTQAVKHNLRLWPAWARYLGSKVHKNLLSDPLKCGGHGEWALTCHGTLRQYQGIKINGNSLYYALIIAVGYGLELINHVLDTAMYIISYSIDTSQGG